MKHWGFRKTHSAPIDKKARTLLPTFSHRQGNDNANRKSHHRALKQQRSGEAAFKPLRQGLHYIHDVEQSPAMIRHSHAKRQNCPFPILRHAHFVKMP